jgi:alkanesulfonate monooxygenase SsuD/methylene tetrahydromethanopterin reductase-like flavin-dependent oxidoreductase (luciferase family)
MQFGLFCTAQAGTNEHPPESGKGFQDYLDLNIEAEALGYCSSFLVEHHFSGWNQVSATLTLLTCLAMRTTTLRVGSAVMVLPWHHPVLLAEQAAMLDVMSGGRLDFGIGKGYRYNEFMGFNIPQEEADARFEEALEVITRACARVLFAQGQVLDLQRHRGRAAAGAETASAVVGRGRQRAVDPACGRAWVPADSRPVRFA